MTLIGHIRNMHGEEACYRCNFCGIRQNNNIDLNKHIETKHGIHGGGDIRLSALI